MNLIHSECFLGQQLCESSDIAFVKYKGKFEYYNNNEFLFVDDPVLLKTKNLCTLMADGTVDLPVEHVTMFNALLVDEQVQIPVCNDST